jgi:hypothetical protein
MGVWHTFTCTLEADWMMFHSNFNQSSPGSKYKEQHEDVFCCRGAEIRRCFTQDTTDLCSRILARHMFSTSAQTWTNTVCIDPGSLHASRYNVSPILWHSCAAVSCDSVLFRNLWSNKNIFFGWWIKHNWLQPRTIIHVYQLKIHCFQVKNIENKLGEFLKIRLIF